MSDNENIFSDYISSDIKNIEIKKEENEDVQGELFNIKKSDRIKKDKDDENNNNHDEKSEKPILDPEYEKLRTKSTHAQLYKHIQVEELNHLKIENERVNFLKNAGRVAEISFMDFLYIGYMEKCNLDLIRMVKKLKHRWKPLLEKEILDKITDMLTKEVSYVLRGVKEKQKEEVENWKDGLH